MPFPRAFRCLLRIVPALFLWTTAASAGGPGVSITMVSSPNLTLDSNKPLTEGPRTAFVSFRVTNTSGARLDGLTATISGMNASVYLQSGQAASQYVGSLAAGASRELFWFVSYTVTDAQSATLSVVVSNPSGTSAPGSGTVTTRRMQSAQAGGNLTGPPTLGPGAVVGQTIHFDASYSFGNANTPVPYDLQPVGNLSFDAACFQMVGNEILSSNVTGIPAGTRNQMYFTGSGGNGSTVSVRYFFKYLCAGVSTTAKPYANMLSGTSLKYSANYESTVGPTLPGATNGFTVAKSVSPTSLPTGGTATYMVTVQNVSTFVADLDSIVDVLPGGVTYTGMTAASGVTDASSSSVPAVPSTGTLRWRGPWSVPPAGTLTLVYTATIPATAGTYTNSATAHAGITSVGTGSATVTTGVTYAVGVTPQGLASPVARLPGTEYTQELTVTNGSNVDESFDLLARVAGAAVFATVDSITGPGITTWTRPDSVRVPIAAGASAVYALWHTVAAGEAADNVLYLKARSVAQPTVLSEGWAEVRRVIPAVTLSRSVAPGASPPPGTDLTYTLEFGNGGEAGAREVIVTDLLPPEVHFKVGSLAETLPAGVTATVAYSADGGASWTHTPLSGGCGAPAGYDACVQRIRWTLAGDLPPDAVQSAGTLRFVARIR